MKVLVEILEKVEKDDIVGYRVIESKTIVISDKINQTTIDRAINRLEQLKPTLGLNEKIRVLEFHNDEPDETRVSCKVLFE